MYPLVEDVEDGEGYACVGAGGIWEVSVLFAQFCCEPKTALKNKVYQNKTKQIIVPLGKEQHPKEDRKSVV